jgi:bud site selection protein 20
LGHQSTDSIRLKQLKEEPHTQKEAELAIGLRTDNGNRKTEEATMELDT